MFLEWLKYIFIWSTARYGVCPICEKSSRWRKAVHIFQEDELILIVCEKCAVQPACTPPVEVVR